MNNLKRICLLALCIFSLYSADAQTDVMYYTTKGNFKIRLTDTLTPRTVDSFLARVAEKFYDGLIFHRVIDGFMIQGGDPLGTGYGGPGYTFPDEFVSSLKNVPGALAMANSGANTNGSQFFINLVTNSGLNGKHTVFGMVTTNFTVVQDIGKVAVNSSDKPLVDVVIDSIRVLALVPSAVGTTAGSVVAPISPNPCRGMFNIDLPGIDTRVELLNMQGRVVYCTEASGSLKVDVRNQPTGLYIVRTTNVNGSSASRLIVQ